MTTALILNIVLAAPVFAAILALLVWGIARQGRDGVATVPRAARRRPRPQRAVRRGTATARRQAWPAS